MFTMKKLILAAFSLLLIPSLSLAGPSLRGQIAKDVRKLPAAQGLQFSAKAIKTEALNGAVGGFSFTASRGGRIGLPGTIYNVSGDWNNEGKSLQLSNVKITEAPLQPREGVLAK
jgi:hypothetical protein